MKPFLSVIIPTYNEASRLPLTLMDVDKKLSEAEYSSEVIVVDDGSTDNTVQVVKNFSNAMQNLRVVENAENHGKGWVVREGMLAARGNWRLFMDADNSTSVDQFEHMMPLLSAGGGSAYGGKESYDVVIGSRAVPGAKLEPPQGLLRQILGRMGNRLIQALVIPGIKDTQCGFKCFSEESAERVFRVATIDRWGFDVEALALARHFGYKVKEIPVRWVNDTDSRVKGSAYLSTLRDVFMVRRKFSRGEYGPGGAAGPVHAPPRESQPFV